MLLGLGGLGAEVALGFLGLSLFGTATAGPPPKDKETTYKYRGRTIKISESDSFVMASVDGRMLHIERSAQRRFHTHLLPFQDYPDVRTMIPDLIDMAADNVIIL